MENTKRLKEEIEDLKAKLRHLLEAEVSMEEILDVNNKIDDLILKFYRLQKKHRPSSDGPIEGGGGNL